LNGTRFIAFLPVFFTHCFFSRSAAIQQSVVYNFVQQHLKLGLLALDYFFVLSSFLISWIIYEEYESTKKFRAINFYVRRCLRIFPLYFLVVGIGFAAYYVSLYFGKPIQQLPPLYNFYLFILNFFMKNNGINFLFFLTFFWSVSVEEQFYVLWALVLKYLKNYAHWLAIALVIVSVIFRASHLQNNNLLVFHTFSSLGNFGIGSLLCYLFFFKKNAQVFIDKINLSAKKGIYFLVLLLLIFYNNIFNTAVLIVFERLIFAIIFAFIIADFSFAKQPTFNLEKHKTISYFGTLSFGLYCYHGIVLTLFLKLSTQFNFDNQPIFVFLIVPISVFFATLVLAHFSYKWFENPILKLKKKYY